MAKIKYEKKQKWAKKWFGSAVAGGQLVQYYGYGGTFYVTACVQAQILKSEISTKVLTSN
jgi:hypothetical protein